MKPLRTIGSITAIVGLLGLSAVCVLPTVAAEKKLPLEDLQIFVDVFSKIKNDYVDQVEDSQLLKDAIRGMLNGLDPHSTFLESEDYQEIRHGSEGKFGGLGIEVSNEDGLIKVVAPLDDTPAAKAGLQTGDLIIRIDGVAVKSMSLSESVDLMRGAPGTQTVLTIVRTGTSKPFDLTLTRAVIKIASVKANLLEPGYGYVRIANFQSNTSESMRSKIEKLLDQSANNLNGLILDLRNNPGGILSSAVEVSDTFLSQGIIVTTRGRDPKSATSIAATANDLVDATPLVVLVNGGSASAAEIVAGALQDHKRAIIMGTKTFGKGSVQTVISLSNGAALKITTARYYTPNDRSIQATGIEPDIVIEQAELVHRNQIKGIREADLAGHLHNENDSKKKPSEQTVVTASVDPVASDFQIREALNLLKGMSLVKHRDAAKLDN